MNFPIDFDNDDNFHKEFCLLKRNQDIRPLLFDEERLFALGQSLAKQEDCDCFTLKEFDFLSRNKENAKKILEAYQIMNSALARGETIIPAAQWLLDNYYLVQESIARVKNNLPSHFLRNLPRITKSGEKGNLRAFVLVWFYVRHTDSMVSCSGLKAIVDGFQSVEALKIAELWALPSLLRFVLIESLRYLCVAMVKIRAMSQEANMLADRILIADKKENIEEILSQWEDHAKNTIFATRLLHRLRDSSRPSTKALTWLEKELKKSVSDPEDIILSQHKILSANNVTAGNIIKGLRLVDDINWKAWFESVSQIDFFLSDKTDFGQLDFVSRNRYRAEIEELARNTNCCEQEIAEKIFSFVQEEAKEAPDFYGKDNIGFFLVGKKREVFEKAIGYRPSFSIRLKRFFYHTGLFSLLFPILGMVALFLGASSLLFLGGGVPFWGVAFLLFTFSLPAFENMASLFNSIILSFVSPDRLIGYDYEKGIPETHKTLVVIPTLIASRDDADKAIRNLEVHYWANKSDNIFFALLSDWPDSAFAICEQDLDILNYLKNEIKKLNERHSFTPSRFYLLHRRRLFNPSQGVWMGWERKRGKLHELNQLLLGKKDTSFFSLDDPLPESIAYVMTIDSDTRLTQNSVCHLLEKISHPLNCSVFDKEGKRIVSGHSILQPRITASLASESGSSLFQRFFSSNRGLDPYIFNVSDLYQDLYGQATFTGKGLYHVASMEAALHNKIPENAVLSHDLLEGAFARAGLASDIEIVEDYPTGYLVDSLRRHRWIRGDWQHLPFLFQKEVSLCSLSRWKIVDNLLRSLVPLFSFLSLVFSFLFLTWPVSIEWVALMLFSQGAASLYEISKSFFMHNADITIHSRFACLGRKLWELIGLISLKMIFLSHQAWMTSDAILRTLYRLYWSKKNLLEWQTAAHVEKSSKKTLLGYCFALYGGVILGVVSLFAVFCFSFSFLGLFLSLIWVCSPFFAWVVSQTHTTSLSVSQTNRKKLRTIARKTWHYFETHVTQKHNFLPPDNIQETPNFVVAARTSPTNIGVYFLSIISARYFGWISLSETVLRLEQTLKTLEKMDRYRGHIYNWVKTETLESLTPRYISTVDSGNLASHLIAVCGACEEWSENPSLHLEGDLSGILDVVRIFENLLSKIPDKRIRQTSLRERLIHALQTIEKSVNSIGNKSEIPATSIGTIVTQAKLVCTLSALFHDEVKTSSSFALLEWSKALESCASGHAQDCEAENVDVEAIKIRLKAIKIAAKKFVMEMDFSFLFNTERSLFSIGFRVDESQQDSSCYDLLASEARTTSLVAIAKGDVSYSHWAKLGRPIAEMQSGCALLSWSGSMFEYLMPSLVIQEPAGGIFQQTNQVIIQEQMRWGEKENCVWGISESSYNARDNEMNYQYAPFGVPSLGFKRGLSENKVVAPYAAVLACQFFPSESIKNLEKLEDLGALGQYGFYDAVDFTPQRVPEGETCTIVFNFYAHHQGMSIAAISNALFEGRIRNLFHADPMIKACELLLQEKIPEYLLNIRTRNKEEERIEPELYQESEKNFRFIKNPSHENPSINVMSNGSWSSMVCETGGGYSRWKGLAVTRWFPDRLEGKYGTFIFLRDTDSNLWWSATPDPKSILGEKNETLFQENKTVFVKKVESLRSELECIVLSEADGEARRITIFNDGDKERYIEVTSFAELSLASEESDRAHPAFSKMFLETKICPKTSAIYVHRRIRAAENPVFMAHFVTDSSGFIQDIEAETDRYAFIGRGRTIRNASAFDPNARLSGNQGCVLDPIIALRKKIRIFPQQKISLTFWTIVDETQEEIEQCVTHLAYPESFRRQNSLSWTQSQIDIRHSSLRVSDSITAQKIAGYLVYPHPLLQISQEKIIAHLTTQSALWPMSISGDFPIFVLRIADISELDTIIQALHMQEYLRGRGVIYDCVLVNEQASSYAQDLQNNIEWHCEIMRNRSRIGSASQPHIFALRKDLIGIKSWKILLATADIVLHARNGRLGDQIERIELSIKKHNTIKKKDRLEQEENLSCFYSTFQQETKSETDENPSLTEGNDLLFWNGIGGFSKDTREYVIRLNHGSQTPAPWINIIANPDFGFHTSERGSGFTWSKNSAEFRLTPWSNDPVSDSIGEAFYLYDKETKKVFSPFRGVVPTLSAEHEICYSQGYSLFKTKHENVYAEIAMLVDQSDPVKIMRLKLINHSDRKIELRIYSYIEWLLRKNHSKAGKGLFLHTDKTKQALFARNPFSLDFSNCISFFGANQTYHSFTADRCEFFGKKGSVVAPLSVLLGKDFSGDINLSHDSCAALAYDLDLKPEETKEIIFLLGAASSQKEADKLFAYHCDKDFEERLKENKNFWDSFLETLQVETPDKSFNCMINSWLAYQIFSCRLSSRSAFYQSSGAFGFRDQLQDSLALLWYDPIFARNQILRAAGRQFLEGDVQHWWLPLTQAGVRSTISDDVVWLAYSVVSYVEATGDSSILEEKIPFLEGKELKEGEHNSFFTPDISDKKGTIYEHCARALDLAIKRTSKNGIPLILGGDWNDGFDQMGKEKKGESIWLGWFLLGVLKQFIPLAIEKKDKKRASNWEKYSINLKKNLEEKAWDGKWYQRATFDDGSVLGKENSPECFLDSIVQSWSVLSRQGNKERSLQAMQAVKEHLVDKDLGIIKLFTPPFSGDRLNPGYIASYPCGVRENGGQYTHAAAWVVAAFAELGLGDDAFECFSLINPINHASDSKSTRLYRVEPYVTSGDVYSQPPFAGRGGWSWYTGSAGWLYRAGVEWILGFRLRGGQLTINPVIPKSWPGFSAKIKTKKGFLSIEVKRKKGIKQCTIFVDGKKIKAEERIGLDSKSMKVEVYLPYS